MLLSLIYIYFWGLKITFWTKIDLEHTCMLKNISPNWLFRGWEKQNRWTTIQTHSVLMNFHWNSAIYWISGSKVSFTLGLESSSGFSHFFAPSRIHRSCPWYLVQFWSHFHTFRPESIICMLLCFKSMLRIEYFTCILKNDHFSQYHTVKITVCAFRKIQEIFLSLSPNQ